MTDREIYQKVDEYIFNNLRDVPFDKGLPQLQRFVWSLGDLTGKTGPEIMKIYFDTKSEKAKR